MTLMEWKRGLSPSVSTTVFQEDTTGQFDLSHQPPSKALKMCQIRGWDISCASYPAPF